MSDQEYADYIREGMAKKARREKDLERERKQKLKDEKKAKEKLNEQIFQEKERLYKLKMQEAKESALISKILLARQDYERKWNLLKSNRLTFTSDDIPWPMLNPPPPLDSNEFIQKENVESFLLKGIPSSNIKPILREAILLWHTDKFVQQFGQSYSAQNSKEWKLIMNRVNQISQILNSLWADVR